MKLFNSQLGNSLVEMTLAMAIAGIMAVPLTGIVSTQLRVPLKISNEISTSSRLQSSTVFLANDAVSARSFTVGENPEYGTFNWLEFAGSIPIAVSARYYWDEEKLLRVLTRDGASSPPQLVIPGILEYDNIMLIHVSSSWTLDETTRKWVYTRGRLQVDLDTQSAEAGAFKSLLSQVTIVADFRPSFERPAPFPSPLR